MSSRLSAQYSQLFCLSQDWPCLRLRGHVQSRLIFLFLYCFITYKVLPIGRNPLSRGVVVSIGGFSWVFPGSTPKCIHVKKHKNAWTYAQTQWKPRNPKPSKLLWLCSRWLACRTLKPEMWVEISTGVERLIDVSATLESISVFRQTFNGNTAWLGAYTSCAKAKKFNNRLFVA